MSQKTREKYGLPPLRVSAPAPAAPPVGAVWNNISRLWMVATDAGMVPCDPQPAAPQIAPVTAGERVQLVGFVPGVAGVLPSIKVSA